MFRNSGMNSSGVQEGSVPLLGKGIESQVVVAMFRGCPGVRRRMSRTAGRHRRVAEEVLRMKRRFGKLTAQRPGRWELALYTHVGSVACAKSGCRGGEWTVVRTDRGWCGLHKGACGREAQGPLTAGPGDGRVGNGQPRISVDRRWRAGFAGDGKVIWRGSGRFGDGRGGESCWRTRGVPWRWRVVKVRGRITCEHATDVGRDGSQSRHSYYRVISAVIRKMRIITA